MDNNKSNPGAEQSELKDENLSDVSGGFYSRPPTTVRCSKCKTHTTLYGYGERCPIKGCSGVLERVAQYL